MSVHRSSSMVDLSDIPPLTSDSDSESENSDNVDNGTKSSGVDTNKNSSNNGTKEDICHPQEPNPTEDNSNALSRQNSDSLSDASGKDDDDDDDNIANDDEDVEDDETESEEDLHKPDEASQLPKEAATQRPKHVQPAINTNSSSNRRKKSLPNEDKLQCCLQQATLAYFNKNYLSSVSEYKIALMMVAEKKMHKAIETWIIRYCLGLSLINLKLVKEIHDGERVFQSLIDDDKPAICILGYLGLAKAYLKQNRFVDAIGPLQEGLRLIGDGFSSPPCCHWPGTLIVIEETNDSPGILKNLFDSLLSECRNPPLPLAVCRYSGCLDPFKTQIYLSDPEFKGYIQVACFEKCLMEFHRDCWRELKATQLDKRSDKELVNGPCVTPDCNSIVCKISIFGCDGNILKTMTVEEMPTKSRKAAQKHKAVSVMHGKTAHQKKVGGKKAKGGLVEEKGRAEEGPGLAENRSRTGEISHGRDELKLAEVKPMDGARGTKVTHRRKSLESNEDQEQVHPSKKKGAEPAVTDHDHLATMQRTDFVALQRKKNEEQDLDWLSKKPKKKRDKERQKKTVHLDEFVEKIEPEDGDDPPDEAYYDANDYGNQFWEIPPFVNTDSREDAWIRSSANQAHFSDCLSTGTAASNEGMWSASGTDVKSDKAAGDATSSRLAADKASNDEELLASSTNSVDDATASQKTPLETAEDIKGNVMLYFEVLLEKLGPCLPDDESVQRELEAFSIDAQVMISEVGGISKLLLQSLKFTQVDGYICLLKDAAKARQKARQRRLESVEGKTLAKRFGQLVGKPDVPVATEGKNTSSLTPVSSASVSAPVAGPKENKVVSSVAALAPSTSAGIGSGKADRKTGNNDGLFGLCDLNEYKEILRAKNMSLHGIRSGLEGKATDDDSNLSVIEKFKKEVHKAACKDRNISKDGIRVTTSPVSAASTEVSVSVNAFVPSYSKSIGNGTVNSVVAAASLPYKDTKSEIRNDGKTTTAYLLDIYKNPPNMVSNLLDIVDGEDRERKAGAFYSMADELDDFLPVAKVPIVDSSRSDFISESGSMVKSTLSAAASEFHFPKFSSSFKSESILTQSTTVPNMSVTCSSRVGSYALYESRLSPCAYSMNSNSPTALSYNGAASGMQRLRAPTPPSLELASGVDVTSFRADCGRENKATNTDQVFSLDDYNYLKHERDDLQQRCDNFTERLQRMKTKHMEELLILKDKLENAEKKSLSLEKEKKNYEGEVEKLRSDLIFTKTSLQSANHLVDVTDRLLNETQNALQSEQEQRRCLHEKYENLLCQLQRNIRGDSNKSEASQATAVAKVAMPPVAKVAIPSVAKAVIPTVDPSSKAGKKTKPGFDKIINALSAMFPNLSKIELSRCVQEVRVRRNNSLSGLTVHEIVACVRDFVLAEHAEKRLKKSSAVLPFNVPNSGKQNNGTNGTSYGAELFEEEVDPCIICHEELNKDSASMLDCGHSFHTECVRKWFREQSTCPTCRNHALLPDEFPALGRPPLFH